VLVVVAVAVDGDVGSGAALVVVSAALVAVTFGVAVEAGAAGVVSAEAGRSLVPVVGWLQPASANVARHARVAAATVGRARARVVITVFLTVTGVPVQRRVGDSDSPTPAVACPDTVSGRSTTP
jgi:hypothetical protein